MSWLKDANRADQRELVKFFAYFAQHPGDRETIEESLNFLFGPCGSRVRLDDMKNIPLDAATSGDNTIWLKRSVVVGINNNDPNFIKRVMKDPNAVKRAMKDPRFFKRAMRAFVELFLHEINHAELVEYALLSAKNTQKNKIHKYVPGSLDHFMNEYRAPFVGHNGAYGHIFIQFEAYSYIYKTFILSATQDPSRTQRTVYSPVTDTLLSHDSESRRIMSFIARVIGMKNLAKVIGVKNPEDVTIEDVIKFQKAIEAGKISIFDMMGPALTPESVDGDANILNNHLPDSITAKCGT